MLIEFYKFNLQGEQLEPVRCELDIINKASGWDEGQTYEIDQR